MINPKFPDKLSCFPFDIFVCKLQNKEMYNDLAHMWPGTKRVCLVYDIALPHFDGDGKDSMHAGSFIEVGFIFMYLWSWGYSICGVLLWLAGYGCKSWSTLVKS